MTLTNYPEFLVARAIGPKKAVLVEIRRTVLKKSVDWVLVNSVVHYTPIGMVALCRAMELEHDLILEELKKNSPSPSPSDASPASTDIPRQQDLLAPNGENEKPGAGVPPPAPVAPRPEIDVVVTGRSPNPQIVYGRLDDHTPVKVRVRDNTHFTPGLILRAKEGTSGIYLMVGPPPRWRGDKHGFTRTTPLDSGAVASPHAAP